MTKNIDNLESLKHIAFCIPVGKPIRITWTPGASYIFVPKNLGDSTYWDMDNVVAFYHENALYVIPSMQKVMAILRNNGFTWKPMCVPFSCGSYPTWHKRKWKRLLKMAKEENCKEMKRNSC